MNQERNIQPTYRQKAGKLVGFDVRFPAFPCAHKHSETTDGLSSDAGSEVLRPEFIRARWRPTGLPSRLACHPVALHDLRGVSVSVR